MKNDTVGSLPQTVRYIKNGQGGAWWPSAKENLQLHLGWKDTPDHLIKSGNLKSIEPLLRAAFSNQGAATRDLNQLSYALVSPSQHIWVTVEQGFLWWCTVNDEPVINPNGESSDEGHFWLTCALPWRNTALNGKLLAVSDLPGGLTMTSAFRSTICVPREAAAIRRTILGEVDQDAVQASEKRVAYEQSLEKLIRRLTAKDFELLVDLILARTGWVRTSFVGKTKEGVDIEAENIAANELAFVQVKSSTDQATLIDYIRKYEERRENYDRMIMAVHSPRDSMKVPDTAIGVQLWTCETIAKLSVRLGLGAWIESQLA
jgi:hypothetical protein